MTYTDSSGRKQRLTFEQATYLRAALRNGWFDRGWGGLSSTQTVRLLEHRGLITLEYMTFRGNDGSWVRAWRVTSITPLGELVLARWRELQQ